MSVIYCSFPIDFEVFVVYFFVSGSLFVIDYNNIIIRVEVADLFASCYNPEPRQRLNWNRMMAVAAEEQVVATAWGGGSRGLGEGRKR